METNNRSAQSILQVTTAPTITVAANKSPSTSHSLSRRASVTSDVNSISTEDTSNKLFSFIKLIKLNLQAPVITYILK